MFNQSLQNETDNHLPARQNIIVSRKIDGALSEIVDKWIDTMVLPWYGDLVHDTSPSIDTLR